MEPKNTTPSRSLATIEPQFSAIPHLSVKRNERAGKALTKGESSLQNQVYAFEPIPVIYDILVRNLRNWIKHDSKLGPKPVALRVALGAEQSLQEFTFFRDSPGESTCNPKEREEQQCILRADKDAASWRKTLHLSNVPHQTPSVAAEASSAKGAQVLAEHDSINDQGGSKVGFPGSTQGLVNSAPACQTSRALSSETTAITGDACAEGCTPPSKGREEFNMERLGQQEAGGVGAKDGWNQDTVNKQHQTFMCSVVPLSLTLRELKLASVDLLKVDVEGDELGVLHGVDAEDWPKIRQVVLEVHDVDGRLASVVDILASTPAAFDEVCWELQRTREVGGYVMVVPDALRMFFVFAKRGQKSDIAGAATTSTQNAGGRTVERDDNWTGFDANARNTPNIGGNGRLPKGGDGRMPLKFCSCPHTDEGCDPDRLR